VLGGNDTPKNRISRTLAILKNGGKRTAADVLREGTYAHQHHAVRIITDERFMVMR